MTAREFLIYQAKRIQNDKEYQWWKFWTEIKDEHQAKMRLIGGRARLSADVI